MRVENVLWKNKYLLLTASFIGGGLTVSALAFFIQANLYGIDRVLVLGLLGPFGIGGLSACLITYFLFQLKSKSERLAKGLFDVMEEASIGVIVWDAEERLVMFNSYYAQIHEDMLDDLTIGISYEEHLQNIIKNHTPDIGAEGVDGWIANRLSSHRSATENREVVKNGKWYLIKKQRLSDGRVIALHIDITEHKKSEEHLQISEKRFRDFTLSAVDRFWETDKNHKYVYYSPSTSRFKAQPESLLGKVLWGSLEGRVEPESLDAMRAVTDRCESFNGLAASWIGSDGDRRYARFNGVAIYDDDGNFEGYRGTTIDDTELKIREEQYEQAKVEAETANRSKSDFLANMSHELRTPLNAIIGFSESLNQELFGPFLNEKQREYVNDINESGKHLLDLISEVLDVSVIEAGRLEIEELEVDVRSVIEAALRLVATRAMQGNVELQAIYNDLHPIIRGDERRLKQIFVNLLSNAIKFTEKGGSVFVDIKKNENGSITISVVDNGIGMNEEGLKKAMEKFGQVERENATDQEGTGLGLPLTEGLVKAHGGTLIIESILDQGTTATVMIPHERVVK